MRYEALIAPHQPPLRAQSLGLTSISPQRRINVSFIPTGLLWPVLFLETLKQTLGGCMQPTLHTLDEAFRPSSLGIRLRIRGLITKSYDQHSCKVSMGILSFHIPRSLYSAPNIQYFPLSALVGQALYSD